ncbi:DUF4435 domain-containing protein [Serratia ureilytica]|uniref:DUF4435 domain-containing protein n=1 Tax=Serratia ureilytica TaxID=300181 RepID=UPI0018D900B2|nr:DUF4435 domain-containing protein [Serratia ureilytica]MBH3094668.1 DUF4435 domain-containing protein [Serratia ureilytica]
MKTGRTFARTPKGVQNYNVFYNVELMVYTEGRCLTNTASEDIKAYDTKYYGSLVKSFTNYKKIKILLVGNKENALDYHKKLIENNIKDCIVFIDKDYDGVFNSTIPLPKLLTTHGYSWENDFWTKKLCRDIIYNISMKDIDAVRLYEEKSLRCINRLDKISRLNIVGQFFDLCILPNSNSKSKGLGIHGGKKWPVQKGEFKRAKTDLFLKVQNLITNEQITFLKSILKSNINPYNFVIQGHLFEYAILLIIGECYKLANEKKTADQSMMKNIAFSIFDQDVKYYLSADALVHYIREFKRI